MADIQLTCPACGQLQTVSEFAEESARVCADCGQAMTLPEPKCGSGLQLKRREPPRAREQAVQADGPVPAGNAPGLPSLVARRSASMTRNVRRVQAHALSVWLSALVFLVLAGGLAYVRFYGGWPGVPLETLKLHGMLALAAVYLLVIGLALRDNMFDGLLSIVVPLYPFYYLFFYSSAVFVRALVGALLVAFGYDALLYLQGWSCGLIDAIKLWIKHV